MIRYIEISYHYSLEYVDGKNADKMGDQDEKKELLRSLFLC